MTGVRWHWTDAGGAAALAALAVAATWRVWADVFQTGLRSEEQSHILLAPLVALWLVWVRRERLRIARPQPSWLGPFVVAAGWGLAVYGFSAAFDLFVHLGSLAMVLGAVLSVVGLKVFREFLPAVLVLVFLFPVPGRVRQQIALPLQEATAGITEWMLALFSVPVSRMGNVLTINGQDVAVAEACNGMRMVAALALISFAFVFSTPMRNNVRLLILAISPILALLVNVIRLVPTALVFGYSDTGTAELFHDLAGWAMLGVALVLLWALLAILRWIEVPISPYAVAEE
ncbi:MAG: exosortase/archaeosortase family protein [Planctomycetota bacterium]